MYKSIIQAPRTWQTSVQHLSTVASSICYSAFFGGSATPAQHTWSTGLLSVADPSLWNSLPDCLRDPHLGRDSFRRLLKTHLFTLYWNSVLEMFHDDTLYKLTYLYTYFILPGHGRVWIIVRMTAIGRTFSHCHVLLLNHKVDTHLPSLRGWKAEST